MLDPKYPQIVESPSNIGQALPSPAETLQAGLDFIRRQYQVITYCAIMLLGLALLYIWTTPPSYTAHAKLLLDSSKVQMFQQQSNYTEMPFGESGVESQVEIIRSESIALDVIKKLHLTDDPEFVGSGGGLVGILWNAITSIFTFSPTEPRSEFALTRSAVGAFESRLNVQRVGLTYIIDIGFRSFNPERAAEIANAIGEAYIDDQLEAKYQAARRAGSWLQDRLHELREQATTAERAVVAFKNKNNMVDAGGRTINEQQLAELNSELVQAQSQTGEARAKADRVQSILASKSPDATVDETVADTLKDDVITKLRSQYLELARRLSDWTVRYGPDHLAVVNVRNQMSEIQTSIHAELQRIAETYKSDLEVAKQREDSLQKQLGQAVSQSQVTDQAQVALRELQSSAQTYQALYDNFLQRYMESVQQQSFPITEARVISVATQPLGKSNPKTGLILGMATMVGLAFGLLAGAWRDFADRVFRTVNQVESHLQTECLSLIPAVIDATKQAVQAESSLWRKGQTYLGDIQHWGVLTKLRSWVKADAVLQPRQEPKVITRQARPSPLLQLARTVETSRRIIVADSGVYSTITDAPFSAFAEAIRSVKVAIDLRAAAGGGKIIGFTSSVPNEGKSTIAASVARLVAQSGAKTLLIDCDLRNPSLSRALSPNAPCGLLQVLTGQMALPDVVWTDSATNMKFIPAAINSRMAHSSEVLASPPMRKLFDNLRQHYEYIIVDFAPMMPIVDVRVSTNLVDAYVYVIEWGKTRINFVEQALRSSRGLYDQLLGVVLNKVQLKAMGRYEGGSGYYLHGNYHRYGYTE